MLLNPPPHQMFSFLEVGHFVNVYFIIVMFEMKWLWM